MRQTTRILALATAMALAAPPAAALADGTDAAGVASGAGGTVLPFSQIMRRCDFSETDYNGPSGMGRPLGTLRSDGSTVTADVQIATAVPNMHYDIRLIQVPRPSATPCWGADPGVAQGSLNTDGAGAATVTLQDNIEPGAKGAFVFISRPDRFSQVPAEFYTTDLIAPF
ncbi:hypothetical protein [Mycobacterium neglectum]|jgi:hypothetical protein|uniref:hypothetical protein n=1 Tax=Mycobacterium neglectum TaxID=242737 RepID=UPI000BFF17C4|nr:hypothetical protein [Mycobacterium neglectum]